MSLLLPPPGEGEPGRDAVAEPRLWSLPPRLTCLRLGVLSPSLLAAISLSPSLTELGVICGHGLDFTRLDLDPADLQGGDGALERPHLAPSAVRAAVSAIELLRGRTPHGEESAMIINGMGWEKPLLPPVEPAPVGEDEGDAEAAVAAPPLGGHAPWLSALGRLEGLRELTLECILLDVLDLGALAENLTNLKVLELKGSPFPAAALPCLAAMPSLERFIFCWRASVLRYQAWRLEEVTLTAMLQLVLGAPSLTTVTVRDTTPGKPPRTGLLQKVQRTLAAGQPGVSISID